MSRKYKILDQDALYFIRFTVINWLDVFIRREYRDIFLDSIRFCQKNKGLEVCAYCIMTSHIHMIVGRNGDPALEGIIRDIKKFTSSEIVKAIKNNSQESRKELLLWLFEKAGNANPNNTNHQFWQQHNKPIELTSEFIHQKLDYIHDNPVEAGIVLSQEDYFVQQCGELCGPTGEVD